MKKYLFIAAAIIGMMLSSECHAQFGQASSLPINVGCSKTHLGSVGYAYGKPEEIADLVLEAEKNVRRRIWNRIEYTVKGRVKSFSDQLRDKGVRSNQSEDVDYVEQLINEKINSVESDTTAFSDPGNGFIFVYVGFRIPKNNIEEVFSKGLDNMANGTTDPAIRQRLKEEKEEFHKDLEKIVDTLQKTPSKEEEIEALKRRLRELEGGE